jgi:hypothetical protein
MPAKGGSWALVGLCYPHYLRARDRPTAMKEGAHYQPHGM